jgi:hypothetical protein
MPQREISSHIFKMAIFSKFFDDFLSHIMRLNAGNKIKYFLKFSLKEQLN